MTNEELEEYREFIIKNIYRYDPHAIFHSPLFDIHSQNKMDERVVNALTESFDLTSERLSNLLQTEILIVNFKELKQQAHLRVVAQQLTGNITINAAGIDAEVKEVYKKLLEHKQGENEMRINSELSESESESENDNENDDCDGSQYTPMVVVR